jgi:hypothetical protein
MRALLQVLAVASILLLDAVSAQAADCTCEGLSAEGCVESGEIREAPAAPPLWCERTDDPRCMPASTQGGPVDTLAPLAMSWAPSLRWSTPSRNTTPLQIIVEGCARAEHSRRVERPPR